jgi:hypothetical protein
MGLGFRKGQTLPAGRSRRPGGSPTVAVFGAKSFVPGHRVFGSTYMGCLLIDDEGFCREIQKLLNDHCGQAIADIGRLDVSHLL